MKAISEQRIKEIDLLVKGIQENSSKEYINYWIPRIRRSLATIKGLEDA